MATKYDTPGVYVEEIPSGIQPIAGVGTSTAGFIGVVAENVVMPVRPSRTGADERYRKVAAGTPVAVDSWETFRTSFGDIQAGNRILAVAVHGFFTNGGAKCWVTSVLANTRADSLVLRRRSLETEKARLDLREAAITAELAASPAAARRKELEKSQGELTKERETWTAAFDELETQEKTLAADTAKLEGDEKALAEADAARHDPGATPLTDAELAKLEERRIDVRTRRAALDGPTVNELAGPVGDALTGFAAIDEIAIVAVPGATEQAVQTAIIDHCRDEKLQDRFAILDGKPVDTLTPESIRGAAPNDYGAIYFPWIDVGYTESSWETKTTDGKPTLVEERTGRRDVVPPSGHIAGLYARVDTNRGVHKAPANEVIRGALGVRTTVSKSAQGTLNVNGVNVIRDFGGRITVWGARTMGGPPEWTYITARRLFIYLRESIDEGTQWAVFEPNAPELWAKIRRNVRAFLTTVWASGALFGTTADEAFYVRCDETTNPKAVRDLGQLVTEVGVALVKPAEFVVFRISQWAGPGE